MKSNFELMASYNQWMNQKLFQVATQLSDEELMQQRGAFFGSIFGTLNHILIGDIIWLKRFASHQANTPSLNYVRALKAPATLDTFLYSTLKELAKERAEIDKVIINFTTELSEEVMTSSLSYRNTKGEAATKNFGFLIQHLFNHQTHHRGQVSTLFNQAELDIGVTDLLMKIPSK